MQEVLNYTDGIHEITNDQYHANKRISRSSLMEIK